jgi:transposase-like protein
MPRYRCSECKRTFNPLTGTSLARLRSRDKWFLFLRTVAQQKSIRKSAEICDIDNNTVLRWRRRFDACTAAEKRTIMMALMESGPSLLALQQQSINALPEWVVDLLPAILTWLG